MSATFTISLPEKLRAAVDDQVAKGGYASRDEYVLELIRRDQARRHLATKLSARADETDSVVMDAADFQQIRARCGVAWAKPKRNSDAAGAAEARPTPSYFRTSSTSPITSPATASMPPCASSTTPTSRWPACSTCPARARLANSKSSTLRM